MAAVLALMSSLMWGSADFLGGSLSRRVHPAAVYGLSQVAGLVALVLIATVAGGWDADPAYWPWAIASSLLGALGMITFYAALSMGPMGIVSPMVALSVMVPVAFGLLVGEAPAGVQVLGIIAAIAGILLASGPELSGAESARPLLLAGIAAGAFGVMYVTMSRGSAIDPLMTMTAMRITSLVVFAGVLALARTLGGAEPRDAPSLVVIGLFDAGANVLFGFATTMGLLSTAAVLGSLYPVVTAVLAAVILHERLRVVQYVGVVVALGGVVLISSAG